MENLFVNTIYPAFMGEVSKFGIGAKCTFLRMSGCNLRCYKKTKGILCDTPEALEYGTGKSMSIYDILQELDIIGNKLVCLTGGEPLSQPGIVFLLEKMSALGYNVVIETNGSMKISGARHIKNVSFIVDFKGKSTGETSRMNHLNYPLMNGDDFLKFVVDDEEDYQGVKAWIAEHPDFKGNIAIGTFWGSKISYDSLMKSIHADGLNVYLNMQNHKMACLYDFYKDSTSFKEIFIPREL